MAERMALNAPIQGSAADVIKLAMLGVSRALRREGLRSRLLLQVHDELVLEVADGRARGSSRRWCAGRWAARTRWPCRSTSASASAAPGTTPRTDRPGPRRPGPVSSSSIRVALGRPTAAVRPRPRPGGAAASQPVPTRRRPPRARLARRHAVPDRWAGSKGRAWDGCEGEDAPRSRSRIAGRQVRAGGRLVGPGPPVREKIAVPGISRPRSGRPLAPLAVVPGRPLRLDQVVEDQPGGDELAHPVAEGAVVLDVDRPAGGVLLDVRRAVEVDLHDGQPGRARVVRERPAQRVGDREDQPAARPQHPGRLAHAPRRSRRRTGSAPKAPRPPRRTRRPRNGSALRVGLHQPRHRRPGPGVEPPGLLQLRRETSRRYADPRPRQPAGALRRAAADLQHVRGRPTSPSRPAVVLAQPLRAPEQVGVAEERAVLGVVVARRRRPTRRGWPGRSPTAPASRCTTAAVAFDSGALMPG